MKTWEIDFPNIFENIQKLLRALIWIEVAVQKVLEMMGPY